ncbi:GNAT family N-acetyltransferase [Brachybacterium tyrofermentans]|uniref:GNAT family N-acetyltransferase n=1 Tax=Brachybacterium tyrofermentans TaxID=47848 RepID=UPI003FD5E08B
MSAHPTLAQLLAAYDEQLREEADFDGALDVARHGPLWLVRLTGGRGFVTYRDLGGAGGEEVRRLVEAAVAHFVEDGSVREIEWKSRGHDDAPGLEDALAEHSFVAEETESIMIGPLEGLVGDGRVPEGVRVRRAVEEADVRAVSAMTDRAFGKEVDGSRADALVALLARDDGSQQWVAEVDGRPVSAGRLIPVPGTEFVGIWGGATLPEFRHRGIYRALTAARARSALEAGYRYLHSDSTRFSRPILERSGLVAVSTTTPWVRREGSSGQ